VIVSVGVMVGIGGWDVFGWVAVADGVNAGDGEGVSVGLEVRLGVADGPTSGVRGAAAGTVDRAVTVGDGLGVGLGTAGDASEASIDVGLPPQPAMVFARMTSTSSVANHGAFHLLLGRRGPGLLGRAEC